MRRTLFLVLVLLLTGCALKAPPQLPPGDVFLFQANQALVAVGTVQHAAIELNKIQVCPPAPCHPLLSDTNTKIVSENAARVARTVRAAPNGWRAVVSATLLEIQRRLDASGKTTFDPYLQAATTIIAALK